MNRSRRKDAAATSRRIVMRLLISGNAIAMIVKIR